MRNISSTSEPCSKACRSTVSDVMLYVLPPSCPPATNTQAMHQDVWSRYCGGVSAYTRSRSQAHSSLARRDGLWLELVSTFPTMETS